MKRRLMAILLCLSVLLMACACAAETMEPPAIDPVSEEPASQVTLSEVNAESSKTEEPAAPSETAPTESEPEETISIEESDVVIEPIQPIVPEEKETTLEKVLSFDIGIDGMIAYDFLFYDEPSTAQICLSGEAYADGNGVFYHTDGSAIVRVNDGARFPFISYSQVFDIEICGDDFYILKAGKTGLYSILYHYDISTGFETPTLKATYDNLPSGSLGFVGGVPVVLEQGKVYSVGGKLLDTSKTPFVIRQWEKDSVSVQMQDNSLSILQGENFYSYVAALSDSVTIVAEAKKRVDDTIYASYDQNGNVRTRFLYDRKYDKPWASCAVDFIHAGERYTATVYCPFDAVLGDQAFEDLLDGWVFFDVYGNAYYAAYYLDHCDIWRIDQGYSDVQFPVEDA